MATTPIQVIFVVIFVVAMARSIIRARAGELSVAGFIFWFLLWGAALLVVVLPDSTFYLARVFGVGRGADFIVYAALVVLFLVLFKVMTKLEKLERNITKIVRSEALKDKLPKV